MANKVRTRITAREYVEQYPETTQPMELIDGEVFILPYPKDVHTTTVSNLMWILLSAVYPRKLGRVLNRPADVHFDEFTVLQPDVLFVSNENQLCKVADDGYLHGAPDLCVEVVSSSSEYRDRHRKPAIYAAHGVREFWLVEPEAKFIAVYTLEEDAFVLRGVYQDGEQFTCHVLPELTVKITEIFAG